MVRLSTAAAFVISAVVVFHAALVAQGATPSEAQKVEMSRLKGFLITLVLGDTQAGPTGPLTPAAAKALADMKDFLPYKSYRALDTAPIIAGSNGPNVMLRGEGAQKYEFGMRSTELSPTVTKVDLLRLWKVLPEGQKPNGSIVLIDAAFKIELGETVVVGTSRLEGSQALILLVTAVPK